MTGEFFMERLEYFERYANWKWLKMPLYGAGATEVGAMVANIDWAHVIPLVGLAITAIGTACIGLYRYWRLTQIELRERERQSDTGWVKVTSQATATAAGPPTIVPPIASPPRDTEPDMATSSGHLVPPPKAAPATPPTPPFPHMPGDGL